LGSYLESKGTPILIPWIIIILNVVNSTLSAIFERRKELGILSALGLNPTHITSLFLAESLIVAISAGGIGYLLGLGWYRIGSLLSFTLEVRQKVSAAWCLGALSISITAVLTGTILGIRNSIHFIPSSLKKWKIERRDSQTREPWTSLIPIRIPLDEIDSFFRHVSRRLERMNDEYSGFNRIRSLKDTETLVRGISFTHFVKSGVGSMITRNKLTTVEIRYEAFYQLNLITEGSAERSWVQKTAGIIRKISLEYSIYV
jgi:hypothetical protein